MVRYGRGIFEIPSPLPCSRPLPEKVRFVQAGDRREGESVHRVIKAEKVLKEKGIEVDLIPVPREISSDCEVAVGVSRESVEKAFLILREQRISMTECYTKDSRGRFEKTEETQISF